MWFNWGGNEWDGKEVWRKIGRQDRMGWDGMGRGGAVVYCCNTSMLFALAILT